MLILGDNYKGEVSNVNLKIAKDHLCSISFEVAFPKQATLDDILSGEGNITFRNDFNLPYMNLNGRIQSMTFIINGQPVSINNGEFPPRYKPAFVRHRPDRITDIWKTHFDSLYVVYVPPPPVTVVHIPEGLKLVNASASNHKDTLPIGLYYRKIQGEFSFPDLTADFASGPVCETSNWTELKHVDNTENSGHFHMFEVGFDEEEGGAVIGPCTLLLTSQKRIGWQGVLRKL